MRPRRWILLPIIAWALVAAADDGAFTLDNVLERSRPEDGRFASAYHQTRESTLLTEEIRTRGRIVFKPPDRLRRTEHGSGGGRETIEVRDGTVHIDDGDSTTQYPLARAPTLALLMDVLAAMATGDAERLRTDFGARLGGSWNDWHIALDAPVPTGTPGKDGAGESRRARVTIAGVDGRVDVLTIDASGSGRIRIHFTDPGGA